MYIISGSKINCESGSERTDQPQIQEVNDVKQGNTRKIEIDLMRDIISDLECSLNNEYE